MPLENSVNVNVTDYRSVALKAIAEAIHILRMLASRDGDLQWLTGSVPLRNLDELARSLGYPDAHAVHSEIEGDRQHEADKHRDFDWATVMGTR